MTQSTHFPVESLWNEPKKSLEHQMDTIEKELDSPVKLRVYCLMLGLADVVVSPIYAVAIAVDILSSAIFAAISFAATVVTFGLWSKAPKQFVRQLAMIGATALIVPAYLLKIVSDFAGIIHPIAAKGGMIALKSVIELRIAAHDMFKEKVYHRL